MALPVLDVTARDFDALVTILQQRALSKFDDLPQTDFNISNFTQMFIDLFAGVGDGLHFYQDNQAQDMFWPTVRRRENAIKLGAAIGYRLPSASAAVTTLRFSIPNTTPGDVIIPARTQVKTNDPVDPLVFETLLEAIIVAGSLFVDVEAENAEVKTETFVSTGEADQRFTVESIPFIESSASVEVAAVEWTEQEDFFNSKTTDQHYIVETDEDDRLTIGFGNGNNGLVPPAAAQIDIEYKVGGGVSGRVFADKVKVLEASFTDTLSNSVEVSVTNIIESSGGTDRQSVAEARFIAPRTVKTNQRTIAKEDYEINPLDVAGVSRAKIFTSNDDILIPENAGFLRIVPKGGGVASQALRDAVFLHLTEVKPVPLGFVLNVVSPTYVSIGFTMKVFVKDASFKTAVAAALNSVFTDYFSETILEGDDAGQPNFRIDFAKKFFNSEIVSIAQEAHEQVRNVVLVTNLETTYNLTGEQFPQKGVLLFQDGDTLLPLE